MIYQLGQISNRDSQLLYMYRILRHDAATLNALYLTDTPDIFMLESPEEVTIDGELWYEYHLAITQVSNRIPYLEFHSESEQELLSISSLVEAEVKGNELILRGHTDALTELTSVMISWVPSLAYISDLQAKIEERLRDLAARYKADEQKIDSISVNSGYILQAEGITPNLVNIGKDETGLIYSDSNYMLSGAVEEQVLANPAQSTLESMLKAQIGTLLISDNLGHSKVYQGFYGGVIKLEGRFQTLVLRDIDSIVYLNRINAVNIVIENCQAVIFRQDLGTIGNSGDIGRLEVRNSYLTIFQPVIINSLWCYQRSTVVQKAGTLNEVGFVEAGSTLVYDNPSEENDIDTIDLAKIQGLFYTVNPPVDKEYLSEVFLDYKPISFQRGQVEDPLPMEEATVHIYLKHSKSPDPGPSPGPSPEPPGGLEVDTRYTPFPEYVSYTLSDSYMGVLPGYQNIENNIGLGIMYGISLFEYGNSPVSWLYARIFRTYLMLGWYKKYSTNLTEEGRALLNPETGMWSFGTFYNESQLLQKVRADGTQEGLENFYYLLKYGSVLTGYTEDMDDIDKMKIIAGGAPTGNNSETGCPQDHQFHENYYAAGIVDAAWIYDSSCTWVPYGTGRMTYYSARGTSSGGPLNPNI